MITQVNISAELIDTTSKFGQILFFSMSMKLVSDLEMALLVINGILTLIFINNKWIASRILFANYTLSEQFKLAAVLPVPVPVPSVRQRAASSTTSSHKSIIPAILSNKHKG